jgi:hypothetical protein
VTAARRALLAAVAASLALADARPARACAACMCGDQTLTSLGIEKPYRNRVRVALEERYSSLSTGDGLMREDTTLLRTALTASWMPHARVQLGATLPWIDSWIRSASSGRQQPNGLGDLELTARVLLYRERRFAPQHLLWAMAGVKTPTGPRARDGDGYFYSPDDQPGSGSWDPLGGVSYGWYGGLTSVFVSTGFRYTTPGWQGYRVGSQVIHSAMVQLQPFAWGALELGTDVRWADADTLANGHASPNSGGTTLYASPALLASWRNLLVRLGAQVPLASWVNGIQREGPRVMLTIAYDVR